MSDMYQSNESIGNKSFGGLRGAYKRVTSLGADKTPPDTWHDIVFRIDSDLGFDHPNEDIELENGSIGNTVAGTFVTELQVTSAQLNKALFDFLLKETEGQYYQVYLDAGKGEGGSALEILYGVGKFQKTMRWTGKVRQPVILYKALHNSNSIAPTDLPTWAMADASDSELIIPAGQQIASVETSAA